MNQRIRELALQATKEVWGNNPYNGAPEIEGYELDQEKFAELIVRECARQVSGFVDYDGESAKSRLLKNFEVEQSSN